MQQLTQKEILELLKSYKLQYEREELERVGFFSSYVKALRHKVDLISLISNNRLFLKHMKNEMMYV